MTCQRAGWAEQEPQRWWEHVKLATRELLGQPGIDPAAVRAIGISYQMHGLVIVDKDQRVLRPSIIWCDSRAARIGKKAFTGIGKKKCLASLLNSPGNFTASKLRWIRENEPGIYGKIDKIMLPGDYIAMRLTGEINTTVPGLSEGIFWDFKRDEIADFLLHYYEIDREFIPGIVPTFSEQGRLTKAAAGELGLEPGIPVSYRAGDQPNNAFSLNVLAPGEVAAAAGTSGVIYGVSGQVKYDPQSRINTFAHVNHDSRNPRLGVLLCINGTGILYSWLKKNIASTPDYEMMNKQAAEIPIGSQELVILPFGNGAERMLLDKNMGCHICGLNFNIHSKAHLIRAGQEGIAFSLNYGMGIMKETGITPSAIKAGHSNMFLSPVFRDILAGVTGTPIELYNTDGAAGAARGAGIGSGYYRSFADAFTGLEKIYQVEPDISRKDQYREAYQRWLAALERFSSLNP